MNAQEYSRKTGFFRKTYALAVTFAPESEEQVHEQMRLVKQALVAWKEQRGKSCETVMLTVVSTPDLHEYVKELFAVTYREEQDLSPILRSCKTKVALLNTAGKPLQEYALGEV